MEKECICIKTHFRGPHRSIREEKLTNEGITISNKRVYIKNGSFHTFTLLEFYNNGNSYRPYTVDGLFCYDDTLSFNSFYSTDIKLIQQAKRKEKLKKITMSSGKKH